MFKHAHMHTRVRRLKQEDHKFKASLDYTAQSHLERGKEWVRGEEERGRGKFSIFST